MTTDFVIITKDMKNTMGVYGIRRISDGLFYYIGSSKDVWSRWLVHRNYDLPLNNKNSEEYKAFHKLLLDTPDDFEPVLLDELVGFIHTDDRKRLRRRLVEREKMYIRKYIAAGHPIATKPEYQDGAHTGKHHSEETKAKMRSNHADFNGENHPCFGSTFTWMNDGKRNHRVPKGQEEQKKKDGLVCGFIKIA